MKELLFVALACSFAGASCETPSPLNRTCPGSVPQTAYFKVAGSCGATGVVVATVAAADSCAIALLEPTGVALPSTGSFGPSGGSTGYDLLKGGWNLNDPSAGDMNVGTFLSCTSQTDDAGTGIFDMMCEQNICAVGDSDDVQCMTGTTCTAHFVPTLPDAGAPATDATTAARDAGN